MSKQLALPDFEDMYARLEAIREVGLKKLLMRQAIDEKEAEIVLVLTSDEKYFDDKGKPPSMALINRSYLITGLDNEGELPKMREQYARVCAEYDYLNKRFDLDKIAIDVWRTQSANERKVID